MFNLSGQEAYYCSVAVRDLEFRVQIPYNNNTKQPKRPVGIVQASSLKL